MIYIQSNGSKWHGQQPDTIEKLLEVLEKHPLDSRMYPNGHYTVTTREHFIHPNKCQHLIGSTHFSGNFVNLSHVFSIYTDEPEVIQKLTEAIDRKLMEGVTEVCLDSNNKDSFSEEQLEAMEKGNIDFILKEAKK